MSDDILDEIYGTDTIPSEEDTTRLRELCTRLANERAHKEKLERELKSTNKLIWDLEMKEIPDLAGELGVDVLGLPEMNVDIKIKPYYKANISSQWPAEKQETAFKYLEEIGVGDIIRNEVKFSLGKESDELAEAILEAVSKIENAPSPSINKTVPWNTLTGVVREFTEKGEPIDLEVIGATVGQKATIKERKE